MAKKQCSVCDKPIGIMTSRYSTADQQLLCGACLSKSSFGFSPSNHTMKEYNLHLQQLADGNRIFEALFKTRINLKQEEEGSFFKAVFKKNNSDETVKKFGQDNHSIWLVEDFGLILVRAIRGGVETAENTRNLVFRYTDLISYHFNSEYATTNDNRPTDYLNLKFSSSYVLNEISVQILGKEAYGLFDTYFSVIMNGDQSQWDVLADNALARV